MQQILEFKLKLDLMPKARELRQRAAYYRKRAQSKQDVEKAKRYHEIANILDQEAEALARSPGWAPSAELEAAGWRMRGGGGDYASSSRCRETFHEGARGVIEPGQPRLMVLELGQRVQSTRAFLRLAAIELRRVAERAPDIAFELQHMAQQLEAEERDLASRDNSSGDEQANALHC